MKKAFTLIELLVVVLVIASLVGIVFRLGNITGAQTAVTSTMVKLQKLENCLSGYYAAFGNYPPVKLHGSRSIFCKVNAYGIQQVTEDEQPGVLNWGRVDAACMSQPVAMNYPFSDKNLDYIDKVSKELKRKHDEGKKPYCDKPALAYLFDGIRNPAMLSAKMGETEWTEIQLFRFGLLSFLLPRYVVMVQHAGNGWDEGKKKKTNIDSSRLNMYDQFAQWNRNNQLPCRFDTGLHYPNWQAFAREDKYKVMLMPSQAVTQRWAPNLKDIVPQYNAETGEYNSDASTVVDAYDPDPPLYSAGDSQGGEGLTGTQQYVLDGATVRDDFKDGEYPQGKEFYYYSPRPYQTYRLWSAGPNHKSFPPWIPEETIKTFGAADQQKIYEWMKDDLVKMKE